MPEALPPPDECANCGAELSRTAKACPECGADERTGWREESVYDGLDLPETDDDRSAMPRPAARRFGQRRLNRRELAIESPPSWRWQLW